MPAFLENSLLLTLSSVREETGMDRLENISRQLLACRKTVTTRCRKPVPCVVVQTRHAMCAFLANPCILLLTLSSVWEKREQNRAASSKTLPTEARSGLNREVELGSQLVSWLDFWLVEVLLYVHRNRRLIRDGSPGRPPRLSHSSRALLLQVSTVGSLGTVFVSVFSTTVKRTSCGVHMLLYTGEVPSTLMSIVLAVAVGLSCFCGSDRFGQAIVVNIVCTGEVPTTLTLLLP